MSERLPLNNQQVIRPLVQRVAEILESNRDRINLCLNKYLRPGGGREALAGIYVGRRPSRNLRTFPNITITGTSRAAEWEAHRQSKVTVTLRIFCNVFVVDDDYHEYMMQDLADVVESILMQNPIIVWEGMSGDPPTPTLFTTHTCAVAGVAYGTVDSGFIKSAQIDWGCQFLIPWNNINYVTDRGVNTSATAILFHQQPSTLGLASAPFSTQPITVLKNDLGQIVNARDNVPVSLSIKEGTGTAGATLSGLLESDSARGYGFYDAVEIDLPGTGYILQASYDTGDGIITGESMPITLYANPTQVILSTNDDPTGDTPFTLMAQAVDDHGNSAFGWSEQVVLQQEDGAFLGGVAYFIHGVATFPNISLPSGDYTLHAVSKGLTGVPLSISVG